MLAEEGSQVEKVWKYEGLMMAYARDTLMRSSMGGKLIFDMRPFEELKPCLFEWSIANSAWDWCTIFDVLADISDSHSNLLVGM